jgi:hypothetical protein
MISTTHRLLTYVALTMNLKKYLLSKPKYFYALKAA